VNIRLLMSFGWVLVLMVSGQTSANSGQTGPKPTADGTLDVTLPITSCSALLDLDLTSIGGAGSKITDAHSVKAENGSQCQIEGNLSPTIGFKVMLPEQTWTQRYMQLGCGGLCGSINLSVGAADTCVAVNNNNFVLATTDMGHQGPSSEFGRDAQKRIDFAYRSVHITSLAAKAIIAKFYGQAAVYSYFNGCSDGGREALMEAQRYPDDFEGIIAGAPAMNFSVQNSMHHGWLATSNEDAQGKAILHTEDMPVLHQAVLDQCDANDGVKDGLITDPRSCKFDPEVVLCKANHTVGCLSANKVNAARKIYTGPHDPMSGMALALGAPMPGSELSWPGVFVPAPGKESIFSTMIVEGAVGTMVYQHNPDQFSLADLKFTQASFDKLKPLYGMYSAVDPDLTQFNNNGNKLILWHGWSDPHISPINSVAYYEAVEKHFGKVLTDQFMKFYLIPGMYHCSGGEGPNSLDLLTPMMEWVEQGKAPDQIITSQYAQGDKLNRAGAPEPDKEAKPAATPLVSLDRTRPIYPYPLVASYNGSGSVNDAANFHSIKGNVGPARYLWAGEDFYQANKQLQCAVINTQLKCEPITQ
jgi:hypothetical protein